MRSHAVSARQRFLTCGLHLGGKAAHTFNHRPRSLYKLEFRGADAEIARRCILASVSPTDRNLALLRNKALNKDGSLITADYVLPKPEHNRCYHTPTPRLPIPFLRFPSYRTYLNGRVANGAALACGSCLMSPRLKSGSGLIAVLILRLC